MIIDATRGSIARFVNHSCEPNCRMVKWIVAGKPRMALFAGDRPIMTGEELTYDYNFDPFSAKNVQKCRCGSENCRGILGPRPKDQKPRGTVGESIKQAVSTGKRKLKEFLGGKDDKQQSLKKRKVVVPTQRLASKKVMDASEGLRHKRKGASPTVVKKKTSKSRIIEKLGGAESRTRRKNQMLPSSHNSRLTSAKASLAGRKKNVVTGRGGKNAITKGGRMRGTGKRRRNIIKGLKNRGDNKAQGKRG
jgi:[histone H3]-lysine4 N-trimethyltransferase ASH1L